MGKKGDFDTTLLQWVMTLILLIVVIESLYLFINQSANGINFNKNFLSRDAAVIINTLYLSPGDSYAYYPITSEIYRIYIGRFEEGYRVKAGSEDDLIASSYKYAEDSFKNELNAKIGNLYRINGLMFLKNKEGITATDVVPENAAAENEKITGTDFAWPVDMKDKVVTSCYGSREGSKIKRCGEEHCGIDIRVKDDGRIADVVSISDGRVISINPGMGEAIIDHGDGILAIYDHMEATYVKTGDFTRKGQKIGKAGNKGNEVNEGQEHLHLGIMLNDKYADPLNIGIFNPKELKFVKGSNCFYNSYSYALGDGI